MTPPNTHKEKKKPEYTKDEVDFGVLEHDFDEGYHPLTVCSSFIEWQPIYYDEKKVWWIWDKQNSKWKITDDINIFNIFVEKLRFGGIINTRKRMQYLIALQMTARKKEPKQAPVNWIQFRNNVIDIETKEKFKPNPEYFFTNPLPWSYSPKADTPIMDKLFTEWVGAENVQALYELVAYCLLRDYPIQRIFVLIGGGSNGKGSFLRLLRKFLGHDNCTSSELERLSNPNSRFESNKLRNKLMCEIAETNVNVLKYTSFLKRASGGDLLPGEYKNKPAFDFVNYAKLIIGTNSLPMTYDKTDGFYRRWNILDFNNKFQDGKEITEDVPDTEYANLARKSVTILKKLLKRRSFINDGNIDFRKRRYEEKSNPIKTFINLFYQRESDCYVVKNEFNDLFSQWSSSNGYRHMNNWEINKALRNMGYETNKQRKIGEVNTKVIEGLKKVTKVAKVTDTPYSFLHYKEASKEHGYLVTSVTEEKASKTSKETIPYPNMMKEEVIKDA